MKLGIVVVYFVKEENEALLDLHLKQIEKHTKVPYTIYGSTNRLLPKFHDKVAHQPNLKVCRCPTTDLRSDHEQIYYLEHLIGEAIRDGCSHIVTLHVDSFPLRSDWAETLAGKLSGSCVFAVPYYGNYTACLFFGRDFYLAYQPRFTLSQEETSSEQYVRFCREFDHIPHAGIGFFFKAYREGLSWFPLTESKKPSARYVFHSNIYNDIIYHLNAAASPDNTPVKSTSLMGIRKWMWRYLWASVFRIILLTKIQQKARGSMRLIRKMISWGWRHIGVPLFYLPVCRHEREKLLEDPEAYLHYLRTGKKSK